VRESVALHESYSALYMVTWALSHSEGGRDVRFQASSSSNWALRV
jgi:hypothetical protein